MWNAKSWWGHLIANDKTICGRNPMKNALGCYLFVAFLFFSICFMPISYGFILADTNIYI
jgi:hypothetical protein